MKSWVKEIVLCIAALVVMLLAILFFHRKVRYEKVAEEIDLFALIASDPYALMLVNRPLLFDRTILDTPLLAQIAASKIATPFFEILKNHPELHQTIISFHDQGEVMYAKTTPAEVKKIKGTLQNIFPDYPPQQLKRNGLDFTFYAGIDNRFFGYHVRNGIFIAGYSRRQLEEVAHLLEQKQTAIPRGIHAALNNLNIHSPFNLIVSSSQVIEPVVIDERELIFDDQWLSVDLFLSEGSMCVFTGFKATHLSDSLIMVLGDTLAHRLDSYFVPLTFTPQLNVEEELWYFTACGDIP